MSVVASVTENAVVAIRLNGERTELAIGTTLADLVATLGRNPLAVAIERNGEIVRRVDFGRVRVEAEDRLEIVQFVQGG